MSPEADSDRDHLDPISHLQRNGEVFLKEILGQNRPRDVQQILLRKSGDLRRKFELDISDLLYYGWDQLDAE